MPDKKENLKKQLLYKNEDLKNLYDKMSKYYQFLRENTNDTKNMVKAAKMIQEINVDTKKVVGIMDGVHIVVNQTDTEDIIAQYMGLIYGKILKY